MTLSLTGLGSRTLNTFVLGGEKCVLAEITFDDSYASGGELVTAATFGLARLDTVLVSGSTLAGRIVTYLSATKALKVYSAVGTEVAGAVDLSADKVTVLAIGV